MATPPIREPLGIRARFLGSCAAWALLVLGSPGFLSRDGLWILAPLGFALWGAIVARPLGARPWRALAAEALASGLGATVLMWWVAYVVPQVLPVFVLGFGVYYALAGTLARWLLRALPIGLAVALAWLAVEVVRDAVPPPFGVGWLRLGHYVHAVPWLAKSARVFGVEGLGLALASVGGALAELLVARRLGRASALAAGAAVAATLVLARTAGDPPTEDGPRLLLVQPALPQRVKQFESSQVVYERVLGLTHDALRGELARGATIDLVCWGETMLPLQIFEPGVRAALERGLQPPAWWGTLTREDLDAWEGLERRMVVGEILRGLPAGTSFLAGAEVTEALGSELRRRNAVLLWNPDGSRSHAASKRHLVPGAETMLGLERFELVRKVVAALVSYVPDFAPARETGVLELRTRDGRSFRFGATVCFDNAFLDAYLEPVLRGELDFHVVASNEAWYRESCELDQMVAFSRLIALCTGRSVVRATNSGVTTVIDPDGAEVARLEVGGRDRSVPGALLVTVPVPREPWTPLYARTRDGWRIGTVLAPFLAFLLGSAARKRRSATPVR